MISGDFFPEKFYAEISYVSLIAPFIPFQFEIPKDLSTMHAF